MSKKRLYALTDNEAETLRALARESATTVSNYAADALTPVTVDDLGDDAIERMARAAFKARYEPESFTWAKAGLLRESYRADAHVALNALLEEA